jgi:site-specific DNA-methyltransferase (adenine-specific)
MTCELRLADAFVELPAIADASVDHTITDPPYNAKTHKTVPRSRHGRKVVAPVPFASIGPDEIAVLAEHIARATRRWILVFCADRQIEAWARALERSGATFVRVGITPRTNPAPQLTGDRPAQSCEFLVIAHGRHGARWRWNGGGRAARWDVSPDADMIHPTQKPIALMRALVRDFTSPGDLVLDPFAGSGTTAVACRESGRRFLGFEIDASYHAGAMRRISSAHEQMTLSAAHKRMKQEPLW